MKHVTVLQSFQLQTIVLEMNESILTSFQEFQNWPNVATSLLILEIPA